MREEASKGWRRNPAGWRKKKKKNTIQFVIRTFFWRALKVCWPCQRPFLTDKGLKECTAIFLARRTLPHCMYGNGANTWMLRNPGKTLLIQHYETVEKRCFKAMHKVNTSNSSRQVVSMALNTESTTQYLDYSYWLKACFFFFSPWTMLSWVSVCMEQLFLTR